jgi:hypothetical protein
MGLFDLFTGAPAIEAAEKNRNLLTQTQGNVANRTNTAAGQAQDFLKTGFGNAGANLGTGYNTAVGRIGDGAGDALGFLNRGEQGALGQLGQARGDLTAGGGAYAPLSALAQRYGQGGNLYADSLGIGGPEGNQRAQQAFQAGPGYQFALDQGLDAINRRANAAGMLVGGNANRSAQDYGFGLANQEYGNWQNRLKGIGDQELQATAGAAQGNQANNTTLAGLGVQGANIVGQAGRDRAGLATGQGNTLADLASRYYGGLAGLDTAQGGALAGNTMGAAGQINSADLNLAPQIGKTFQDEANASLAGSKNLWGMGLAAAQMAMGMPPTSLGSIGTPGATMGGPGGNLGASGSLDPSMWNKTLPANGFSWG